MLVQHKNKEYEIETVDDWREFLFTAKPSESFVDAIILDLPEEYFSVYVDEYLKLEL